MPKPLRPELQAALSQGELLILSERLIVPSYSVPAQIEQMRDACRRRLWDQVSALLLDGTTAVMQLMWSETKMSVPYQEAPEWQMEARLYVKLLPDYPLIRRREP